MSSTRRQRAQRVRGGAGPRPTEGEGKARYDDDDDDARRYPFDALRTLAQTRKGAKTLADLGAKTLVKGAATTSSFAFFVGGLQFSIFAAVRPRAPAVVASARAGRA